MSKAEVESVLEDVWEEIRRRESVCLFVDNSNLFGAIQGLQRLIAGRKIDYIKLRDYLGDGRSINCAKFYYNEPFFPKEGDPKAIEEAILAAQKRQGFYHVLQKAGYSTVCLPEGRDSIEMDLIYDMATLSRTGQFNTFVLVAGNENYARTAMRVRQETGTNVEVAFFQESCSHRLRQAANDFLNLSEPEIIAEIFRNQS